MEDLPGALSAAQAKLNLLTRSLHCSYKVFYLHKFTETVQKLHIRLGDGLVADLPAAHMEVFVIFYLDCFTISFHF